MTLFYTLGILPNVGRPHDPSHNALEWLTPHVATWVGSLVDVIDVEEVTHWKGWLGELEWAAQARERRMILTSGEKSADLYPRITCASSALLLTEPLNPVYGESWQLGGIAEPQEPRSKLISINSHSMSSRIRRPFYDQCKGFRDTQPWKDSDDWFGRWKHYAAVFDNAHAAGLPRILDVAIEAFQSGIHRPTIDFSIPDFIRAAECILAISAASKGGTGQTFAKRAMQIAGELAKHWYIGGPDLKQQLETLYKHRNECVHGKVPFDAIAKDEPGNEVVGRFACLAEVLDPPPLS